MTELNEFERAAQLVDFYGSDWSSLSGLSGDTIPPSDLVDIGLYCESVEPYAALVRNRNAPPDALEIVADRVCEWPDFETDNNSTITFIYSDAIEHILTTITDHPNVSSNALEYITGHRYLFVAHAAAKNPKAPIESVYDVLRRIEDIREESLETDWNDYAIGELIDIIRTRVPVNTAEARYIDPRQLVLGL
ncbi:MAG: hypothetical protein ABIJ92_03825 [Candidatus Aenigmatarchaeota archaeon]